MSCIEVDRDKRDNKQNGRNPPKGLDSGRFGGGSKLLLHELIIVEVLVWQIHRIVCIGISSPARIMVCSALWACQRIPRNIFPAHWTYLRCLRRSRLLSGHGFSLSSFASRNNAL